MGCPRSCPPTKAVADFPLAAPKGLEQIYLARGEDIAVARPILTGDVFTDVQIDADEHEGLVMVVAHPCSMRGAQGALLPRIAVAPIRGYSNVPLAKWPDGHYKVLPLPGLLNDEDASRAVHLLELSAVRSNQLDRGRRILSLTDSGIHILQQRLVHSLTRVVVGLDRLQEQAAHVLLEAELEEEWVDELTVDDSTEALSAISQQFAVYMDEGHRDALLSVTTRSDTVRTVRAEIRRRRQSGP